MRANLPAGNGIHGDHSDGVFGMEIGRVSGTWVVSVAGIFYGVLWSCGIRALAEAKAKNSLGSASAHN